MPPSSSPSKMTGLYLQDGHLSLRHDLEIPTPEKNEALIRVLLAGICATDLELVKGYAGGHNGVLGHEFVGVVEGCAIEEWVGRRVVGSINLGCGVCEFCEHEGPEHCQKRIVMGISEKDGVFAHYVTLPIANLVLVPDNVTNEQAVFTEPLAAAVRLTEQVSFQKESRIAVIGPGRLGMLIAQVLMLHGAFVTVYGRSEASLELPHQWGFQTDLVAGAPENEYEIVVEATGNTAGLTTALQMVRPLGTLMLKSTFAERSEVDLTKIVVDEITLIGSRCGPFQKAMHLLEKQLIPVTDLIDGRYPLHQGLEAIEHAGQKGIRKILLETR